jgi:hypothetical protein
MCANFQPVASASFTEEKFDGLICAEILHPKIALPKAKGAAGESNTQFHWRKRPTVFD